MKLWRAISIFGHAPDMSSAWPESDALGNCKTITTLDGNWILSPANVQPGRATTKGPAAQLVGTGKAAIRFRVVARGSSFQENRLPSTEQEMVRIYHGNDFKTCSLVPGKHCSAKQNQADLILDAPSQTKQSL